MFRFLVISSFLALACGNVLTIPPLDGRIVGGENTTIESTPYQVSLRLYGNHACGGSILKVNIILTAAHCLWNMEASAVSIQYARTSIGGNENVIRAIRVITHPNYDPFTSASDVGLVTLQFPINRSDSARPIPLAIEDPEPGIEATVTGWGRTSEGGSQPAALQRVKVKIEDRSVCEQQYAPRSITEQMICAGVPEGGKDSCQGDSGGPLVVNGTQVGVVSWGYGCARPNYSGVYASVANLRSWIEETASSLTAQSDN